MDKKYPGGFCLGPPAVSQPPGGWAGPAGQSLPMLSPEAGEL